MPEIQYPHEVISALDSVMDGLPKHDATVLEDQFMTALHGSLRGKLADTVRLREISAGYPALRAAVSVAGVAA